MKIFSRILSLNKSSNFFNRVLKRFFILKLHRIVNTPAVNVVKIVLQKTFSRSTFLMFQEFAAKLNLTLPSDGFYILDCILITLMESRENLTSEKNVLIKRVFDIYGWIQKNSGAFLSKISNFRCKEN